MYKLWQGLVGLRVLGLQDCLKCMQHSHPDGKGQSREAVAAARHARQPHGCGSYNATLK